MYHDCHLRNVLFSAIMHGVVPLPCLRVQERKRHSALAPRSPGTRPWRRPGGTWAAEHTAWATAGPAKRLHPALTDLYSATECSSGACAPGPRSAAACSLIKMRVLAQDSPRAPATSTRPRQQLRQQPRQHHAHLCIHVKLRDAETFEYGSLPVPVPG